MAATAQDVLNAYLPGGVHAVFMICLKSDEYDAVDADLKRQFPAMARFQAYDFRKKGSVLSDYDSLPFPVSKRVKHDVITHAAGTADEQIVAGGAVGCAQSHFLIWKSVADRPGWTVIFETDAKWAGAQPACINEPSLQSADAPGMIMLGRNRFAPGHTRPVPSAPNGTFVQALGKWIGTDGYVIRNAAARAYLEALVPLEGHIDMVLSRMAAIGAAPPIWRTNPRWTAVKQSVASTTGGSTFAIRRMLPDNNDAANALIITPYAVIFAVIITIVVLASLGFMLVRKKKS